VGDWRVPWSFRVWRGKGHPSPAQLACKLLATVPQSLVKGRVVQGVTAKLEVRLDQGHSP
jgi:hypothetical protein